MEDELNTWEYVSLVLSEGIEISDVEVIVIKGFGRV